MITIKKAALTLVGLAALDTLNVPALAQSGLIAPRPMTSPQPPQPTNAAGLTTDGWVTVRYSVLADGTPANVRAINQMPPSIDTAPTLETFGRWTFFPGSQNGQAIDWHNNETIVVFRSQGGLADGPGSFRENYAAILSTLDAEEPDPETLRDALAANRTLLSEHAVTLGEIGLALLQTAVIHNLAQNPHEALAPIQMATDPRVPMLSHVELFPAVRLRIEVENALGRTREAFESFNRLRLGLGTTEPSQEFLGFGRTLQINLATQGLLEVKGRIGEQPWRYDASRPFFYLDGIEGEIRTIDLECDTRRLSIEFDAEADYQLPDSLGDCTVFVGGAPGTTFSFNEALPPEEEE